MPVGEVLHVGPLDDVASPADERTRVVLTLQPLAAVLPLAWQHFVRHRLRHTYDAWLEAIFSTPPSDWPSVTSFWQRHHYDVLVAQWASTVGVERLLVVVSEDAALDGDRLLTAAEAELVRQVNVVFHNRKWPPRRYDHVVRRGLVSELLRRAPSPEEPAITTPRWAVERACEIAAADAARIAATGVPIDGDLAALSTAPADSGAPTESGPPLPFDAGVDAVVGAVTAVAAAWTR
jgi:hypothetical protein